MKRLSISLITLLMSMGAWADSDTIYVTLQCKVLDRVAMNVEEGKSQRYSGMDRAIEIGETLNLELGFKRIDSNYEIKVKDVLVERLSTFKKEDKYAKYFFEYNELDRSGRTISTLNLRDDKFSIEGSTFRTKLERYYKNDWQLIHYSGLLNSAQIITANCMDMPSSFNKLLEILEELHPQSCAFDYPCIKD